MRFRFQRHAHKEPSCRSPRDLDFKHHPSSKPSHKNDPSNLPKTLKTKTILQKSFPLPGKNLAAKRKGRHTGVGKRKGTRESRMPTKVLWTRRQRVLPLFILLISHCLHPSSVSRNAQHMFLSQLCAHQADGCVGRMENRDSSTLVGLGHTELDMEMRL